MRSMQDVAPEELSIARATYEAHVRALHPCSVLWAAGGASWVALEDEDKLRWVEAADAAIRKMFELAWTPEAFSQAVKAIERRGDLVVYGGGL